MPPAKKKHATYTYYSIYHILLWYYTFTLNSRDVIFPHSPPRRALECVDDGVVGETNATCSRHFHQLERSTLGITHCTNTTTDCSTHIPTIQPTSPQTHQSKPIHLRANINIPHGEHGARAFTLKTWHTLTATRRQTSSNNIARRRRRRRRSATNLITFFSLFHSLSPSFCVRAGIPLE